MKKLIRSIVNWAYGGDVALEIIILQRICENLGIAIEDLETKYKNETNKLNELNY